MTTIGVFLAIGFHGVRSFLPQLSLDFGADFRTLRPLGYLPRPRHRHMACLSVFQGKTVNMGKPMCASDFLTVNFVMASSLLQMMHTGEHSHSFNEKAGLSHVSFFE